MTEPKHHPSRSYIIDIPVEDFLALLQLVNQAATRNNDPRIKGFYLKVFENLEAGYRDNLLDIPGGL